jgi:GT2 family glycosyltransferase
VGRFDERFFLYSEDEDWERRAVRRGWTVRYCPDITAEHAGGGTDASRTRVRLRLHAAIERYVRKWYGSLGWAVFRAGTLVGLGVRVAARRGAHRRSAVALCRLYLEGPDRAARRTGAVPPPINGP